MTKTQVSVRDVNSQDRNVSPRDRDVCFDGRDETETRPYIVRPRRDETLRNSRPLRGVTKVIIYIVKGDQRWQKTFTFKMIL